MNTLTKLLRIDTHQ